MGNLQELNFNKMNVIKFQLQDIKSAIKYRRINKIIYTKLKKINELIVSKSLVNNNEIFYLSNYVFCLFIQKNNCTPTIKQFEELLKINKATKYELMYIHEIYSYNLLKNIKKTQNYINFLQIFNKFIKINKHIYLLKKLKNKQFFNKKIMCLVNKSFLGIFCENGVNSVLINKNEITNFSTNLIKKYNIEVYIKNQNILENGLYTVYNNKIFVSKFNSYVCLKLYNNVFEIKCCSVKNETIKILYDKSTEVKINNKHFIVQRLNQICKINSNNLNVKLINNANNFGYEYTNCRFAKTTLTFDDFDKEKLTNAEKKQLEYELSSYYSVSNNLINKNDSIILQSFNLNFPIKNLPLLNSMGVLQCGVNEDENITEQYINFNKKAIIPNKDISHLSCDGKFYVLSNIVKNSQLILTSECTFVYLDINSINYSYKKIGNYIKIYLPVVNKFYHINSLLKIKNIEKIYNFIKIEFYNPKNNILLISENKQKLEVNEIYKYSMQFKNDSEKLINYDFCLHNFNVFEFTKKASKLNIFSEEFAILHQKFNKKCDFLPLLNSFLYKNEIINLFLRFKNWQTEYYKLILDYIYSLNKYSFVKVVKDNLLVIQNECRNKELKVALTDQLGQYGPTIVDYFYNGNFELSKDISPFYYCYIYLDYVEQIKSNNLKSINKFIKSISLIETGKKVILNKNNKLNINNVNFVGFNKLSDENGNIILSI